MKTVIISGATGQLGLAVTPYFLEKGYQVIAIASREESLKTLASHPNLQTEVVDLAQERETDALVQKVIARHHSVHAAIMLAGGFDLGGIGETSVESIHRQIALNFETAYNLTRPLLAHMQQQKSGRLVFTGARPPLKPADGKNMVAYSLSKSLLFRLAEMINADTKETGVVATVIAPSTIDTEANRSAMPEADPTKWVSPLAIARILDFICSDVANVWREPVLKLYNNA